MGKRGIERMGCSILKVVMAVLVVLGGNRALAQEDQGGATDPCAKPTDKKIVKLLEDAAKAKDGGERHAKLKATQEVDPNCAECLFQLGISAYKRAKESNVSYEASLKYFEQLKAKCPEYHADVDYYMGSIHYGNGEYAKAKKSFDAFIRFPSDDQSKFSKDQDKKYKDVEEVMPELEFLADFNRNTTAGPAKVVAGVSTANDEYLPNLSPDNELIFFTRVRSVQAKGDFVARKVEELTWSKRGDTKSSFDAGAALPEPFNTGDGYGGVTISVNNKEMFVTVCGPPDVKGYRNCDIFRSHYDTKFNLDAGGIQWEWSELEDLGEGVNTDGWESQPSLTSDGNTLYFARMPKDGSKGMDIYSCTRDKAGKWGTAVALPAPINTDSADKAPFMHSDSRTLYFASKGHRGAGGYDIFFSKLNDDGSWTKPKNLGAPINTPEDEHGLIVSADGKLAYFASNRHKGMGGLDVFTFDMPQDARPDDILVVKGDIKDESGKPVKDATVEIKYLDTRKTEVLRVDEADGKYAAVVRLKAGADVVVTVKKPDHVFDSRAFSASDTTRGGVAEVDMTVQKIEVGKSYRVNDINYATNSAVIEKASEFVLDELTTFLKENPSVRIEIQGHTDNVGGMGDNMALSQDRAFTVKSYLESRGISGARLSAKGYGPTQPVADNGTEAGRAQNRRTAFVITGR
ncbi:MAG: PD40 domain-containing protein [Flavobacteriales bacterium]|nr:MAG: PD40 domain-containing protein [Flavobacteriales bacterium]